MIIGRAKVFLIQFFRLRSYWHSPGSTYQFLWQLHHKSNLVDKLSQFHLKEIQFFARPVDWFGLEEVILEQEYRFIKSVFGHSSPTIVVDLGANIGLFSIYTFSVWPSITVHSVEPSQHTYQILERNRAANPDLNWHIYRYAAWKTDGEVCFENREYSTSSRISNEGIENEIVPAISLTTLLSSHIRTPVDLMKIDIEGAEEAVLCGNEAVLKEVDNLIVEIHPQLCNQDRVVTSLRSAYDFLYQIPGRRSSKALLLASQQPYSFPDYQSV